jgi:DNA-binding transcriptional MerR regulator
VKIGEISKQTGVSQRMIRHFESMNIFSPERRGNYRVYSESDRKLILRIKRLQEQGLSLKEIRTVIDSSDEALEEQLLESLSRNRTQIKEFENKNLLIWESLQSLKLNSSTELLVREGVIMEFVKSFEEKNVVRGRMPYLEVLYETFVHLSGNHWSMKWDKLPMKVLHSTDLLHIHEGVGQENINDLKVIVSSEEQQFRNAFVFFLSPELLKSLTGKDITIESLEEDKDTNLIITQGIKGAIETFLLTNMYTENEKERFSIGLPYRFVSIVYNLLKR